MEVAEDNEIHTHCINCINIKKCPPSIQRSVGCDIISCDLDCGSVFHACKKDEHKLLCLNEKVPCYNVENGCPCVMQRKQLANHLSICPASVIHCTMEWNRWHIDALSEKKLKRCTEVLSNSQQPQLDVALALRDQRMLQRWYYSNENGHKPLQNDFKRHPNCFYVLKPPKSYVYQECEETIKDDTPPPPPVSQSAPPGLQRSVCTQLNQTHENNTSTFNFIQSTRRSDDEDVEISDESEKLPVDISEENKENLVNYVNSGRSDLYNYWCSNDSLTSVNTGSKCKPKELPACDKKLVEEVNLEKVLRIKVDADMLYFDENIVSAIVSFPTRYLGLGPNLEVSAYPSNNAVYTFLCCQEFRRDEYPWHYRNVHSDIHGGLSGWLQERCPLAQYGCTFSRRRLSPWPRGSRVVFNQVLESFGVVPPPHPSASFRGAVEHTYPGLNITQLPFEVLQHIARFLDSFSLSNLSLTSCLMREVCQTLLVERGIVVWEWQRCKKQHGFSWKPVNKRWFFSSHFTPIEDWIFEDGNNMANHMKTCAYFDRNVKTEPYDYTGTFRRRPNIMTTKL